MKELDDMRKTKQNVSSCGNLVSAPNLLMTGDKPEFIYIFTKCDENFRTAFILSRAQGFVKFSFLNQELSQLSLAGSISVIISKMRVQISPFSSSPFALSLQLCGLLGWIIGSEASMLNRVYSVLGYETCEHPNVHAKAVNRLQNSLKKELFGQHLALNIIIPAVKAHLEDNNPSKALVLSLHGWAGSGKTFTSQRIINAMYAKGLNSSFTRFFMSSYHFPDPNEVLKYQELISRNIKEVVRECPRALFVFDEVDKTPPGVLDVLVPFIDYPGPLEKLEFKKAIFLFLSNTGANDITKITKDAWESGKRREDLTFQDFDHTLSNEAFNSKSERSDLQENTSTSSEFNAHVSSGFLANHNSTGGLYKSRIVEKVLVDYFVPFLPMERQHIISCIKVEAKRHGMNPAIIDEEAERIANLLTYWPADLKLYSTSGCKRIDTFVKYRMAEINLAKAPSEEEDEDDEDSKTEL